MASSVVFAAPIGNGFFDETFNPSWWSFGIGDEANYDAEDSVAIPNRYNGAIVRLNYYTNDNDLDVGTVFRIFRNGADTGMGVTIPASTTGEFTDYTANPVTVNPGDLLSFGRDSTGATTGEMFVRQIAAIATGNSKVKYYGAFFTRAANTTFYYTLQVLSSATETTAQTNANFGGYWSNMMVWVFGNTVTATTTGRTRINAANGSQSVSIGSGASGFFEDTTNVDRINPTDDICYQIVTGATGTEIEIQWFSDIAEDGGRTFFNNALSTSLTFGISRYLTLCGSGSYSTGEAYNQVAMPVDCIARGLQAKSFTNTNNGTSTVTFRKNTAAGLQSVSIGAAATGWFEDTTNTDIVNEGDLVNYQITTGGSSGSLVVSHFTVLIDGGEWTSNGIFNKNRNIKVGSGMSRSESAT